MGIQQEGIEAEQWLLKRFVAKGTKCFQPDVISFENGEWVVNEVKHQEAYEPPPFRGHGLPRWQIETRIGFWILTGIRIRLVIKEKGSNLVYWQWLDILEKGEFFDTFGKKPRRIYPLESFNTSEI